MKRDIVYGFYFSLLLGAACSDNLINGGNPTPCTGSNCTTGGSDGGTTGGPGGPDHVTKVGPGTGTPFDPNGDGSNGVKLDPSGNVVLVPGVAASNKPIIWVANSYEGSISKVDTRTLTELARYYTYPGNPGATADPSRTTVGLSGDVVVANRAWKDFTPGTDPSRASALKIAGDLSGCVDRNHNGKIDTSTDSNPIPWPAGMQDSPDECVIWLTHLNTTADGTPVGGVGTRPRAAGFDAVVSGDALSTQVYIGLHDNKELIRLDAKTGAIIKRINVAPVQPYGLVLDKDGTVWIRGNEGSLGKVEVRNNDKLTVYNGDKAPPCPYGITADAMGRIYTAGGDCVSRFDPVALSWETVHVAGASSLRGVAVDQNYGVWSAETTTGMFHLDGSVSPMKPAAHHVTIPGGNNVGAAIDFDGNPWVISLATSQAFKLDPTADANGYSPKPVKVGNGPYTYSDMTGYQLRNAGASAGIYRQTFPGCGSNTRWYNLSWTLSAPAGTVVVVKIRSAATPAALTAAPFTTVATVPPDKSPVPIHLPAGSRPDYIDVEFDLTSPDPKITPILSGITVGYSCDNTPG